MRLNVFLPTEILVDAEATKINAEGTHGSFCLLPRHIDVVAALVPGLVMFIDQHGQEQLLAVDEGILVKCGDEVRIATGRAVRGTDLTQLQHVIEAEFEALDEHERIARSALARLEANLVRGLIEERHAV